MSKELICLISFILVLSMAGNASADLVAHWKIDEGSGNTVYDSGTSGNDGTFEGDPQWVAGYYGGALEFDGPDDNIDCGNDDSLNITDEITLSAWINMAQRPGVEDWYTIPWKENAYSMYLYGTDNTVTTLAADFWLDTGRADIWNGPDIDIPTNDWTHIAVTFNGTDFEFYVNGEHDYTQNQPGTIEISAINFLFTQVGSNFAGLIDDVRLYNRALTQAEILAAMEVGEGYPYALGPTPGDGALLTEFSGGILGTSLSWKPGDFAVSHDVYFGTDYAEVEAGTGDTFRGNQTGTYFLAGFGYTQNDPAPTGFVPGMTYYWRIDEVNDTDPNSPWKGDVWSFSLPDTKAYTPSPVDGSNFIDPNADLSWETGLGVIEQTVYFGDDYDTVSTAITGGTNVGSIATTYDPGPLELETVYYWRVDTVGVFGPATGDVWSFTTTRPGLGTIVSERWENIDGQDLDALKSYWKYPNNPDTTEVLTRFSSTPNLDSYGGRIHGWVYAPATGDYTFWINTDDNGELWLSTNDDSTNIKLIAQESSYTGLNSWGTGEEQSDPITLQAGEKYYIMALWKEGGGGDHCQVAWQGPGVPERMVIPGTNLSPYRPLKAFGAKPLNRATDVKQVINLEWKPGIQAASHQVYFGTDEEAVRDATTASSEYIGTRALGDESYNPGKLAWDSTYYWRIDEVNTLNPDGPWPGSVWSFTTADFAIVDNFEDYDAEDQIWWNWVDGLGYVKPDTPPHPGNGTGSEVGDGTTTSFTEETIVHSGGQSMPFKYNNNDPFKLKYSEAKLTLSDTRDWTEQGVKALSLWFQGYPASVGSFTDNFNGTYTMTGSGADIWNLGPGEGQYHDEFHYAYKQLTGAGTIIARVDSVSDTDAQAKAGVMIRETLDPNSAHAMMVVTPGGGIKFEGRPSTGAASFSYAQTGITAPHWVKLERDMGANFTVSHSTNGSSWEAVGDAIPENIPMTTNVYVGLAVTSHDDALTCEATFSNITITGNVTGQWASQDIGIMSNDAEPMYVAIANNTGQPAVVVHDDPNAAQIDDWTEWNIDLRDFAGINLADVNSIAIGLGNRNNPQAGGSGKMYFDDIHLYRSRCVPAELTLSEADLNSDCVVDFRDLEIMTGDWLANDSALEADLNSDSSVDFKDYAVLADQWLDEQSWPGL